MVVPLGNGFEFVSNAGIGLRFPVVERAVLQWGHRQRRGWWAIPTWRPERSFNLDAGLHWYGQRLFLSGYLFHNDISDYIERIEVEPDLLTFVNLVSGTIKGVELEGFYQFNGAWSLSFGGHLIGGENDSNEPLADVPANRAYLGGKWSSGKWVWEGRWEQRAERTDFGPGEKPIPAASLLSMSLAYQLREDLALTLTGRNLLDEEYFNSADRKVPLLPRPRHRLRTALDQKTVAEGTVAAALTPSATLLAGLHQVQEDLALTLTGRDLLDEEYFNSADRKVALSPGRAIGFGAALDQKTVAEGTVAEALTPSATLLAGLQGQSGRPPCRPMLAIQLSNLQAQCERHPGSDRNHGHSYRSHRAGVTRQPPRGEHRARRSWCARPKGCRARSRVSTVIGSTTEKMRRASS